MVYNDFRIFIEVNSQMIPENHRLSCSDNETKTVACLNGGSCFAVYVEDRTVQCAWVSLIKNIIWAALMTLL